MTYPRQLPASRSAVFLTTAGRNAVRLDDEGEEINYPVAVILAQYRTSTGDYSCGGWRLGYARIRRVLPEVGLPAAVHPRPVALRAVSAPPDFAGLVHHRLPKLHTRPGRDAYELLPRGFQRGSAQ